MSLSALLLVGCSASVSINNEDLVNQGLRQRGLDPNEVVIPYELTDEMRQWAHDAVPELLRPELKLQYLRDALLSGDDMKLEYSWGFTGTAKQVFEQQKANCLAFTNLFIGMAREVGVPVYYLAVERVETFRKEGDLVVVSDHVAVGYGDPGVEMLVLDFSQNQDAAYRRVQPISDLTAFAMFHSNRGAEVLQEGDSSTAVRWLRTSVAIDPELVPAWVNLGVVLRRDGDLEGAEDAYKRALEIDPRMVSAYQNLAALLQIQGRMEEADNFLAMMQKTPNRNPYSYLSLGDISLRNGRLEEARRFYRRAVNLSRDDAEIYAALGQVAVASGDLRTARRMLRRARKIDDANARTVRLAQLIDGGLVSYPNTGS
ncbi:MAG: tetratricopeptide repeat protein [Acidobacteriota bacterium]